MKCVICKQGETQSGTATVTLVRDGVTIVFKGVPARVCPNCGEEYVDSTVADRLLKEADETARNGTQGKRGTLPLFPADVKTQRGFAAKSQLPVSSYQLSEAPVTQWPIPDLAHSSVLTPQSSLLSPHSLVLTP
jgi:YgiT-type zinc finger domain-containing protein